MKNILFYLSFLFILGSCSTKKEIVYYQDIDETQFQDVKEIKPRVKIEVNDILQVDIKTIDPESTLPFMKQQMGMGGGAGGAGGMMQPGIIKLQGYIVDEFGEIEMPIIGKVQVDGLVREQVERKIKSKLSVYLKNPYVSVRFLNFKFTIQGEVRNPGTFEVLEPNFTLLQALGLAGDLTIRGKRENVLIIRTVNNQRVARRIDLTKTDWMNSPYYFVKQNDYIYVEPNNPKVKTAGYIDNVGTLISSLSFLTSLVLIFLTVN